jgi:hypothetical protein
VLRPALLRRVAAIEQRVQHVPGAATTWDGDGQPLAWTRWSTCAELDELERAFRTFEAYQDAGWPYPTDIVERAQAIYTAAVERMRAGEPDDITKERLEREAALIEQRRQGKARHLGFDPRVDPLYAGPPLDAPAVPTPPRAPGGVQLRVVR